jgi:hypothetical protein
LIGPTFVRTLGFGFGPRLILAYSWGWLESLFLNNLIFLNFDVHKMFTPCHHGICMVFSLILKMFPNMFPYAIIIKRSMSNKERGEKTFFIKQTKHFIYVKNKYIANS